MCGIAAIINPGHSGQHEITDMLHRIRHRGDTAPVWQQLGQALLGNVRLCIVDTPQGTQPIFNEDGTIAVVFNGEIYNHRLLQAELRQQGHSFLSDCDTEILVHLYEEYGIHFLHKLEGMFAFVLYDSRKNEFYGVRDFFGVKPFYYCMAKECVYISSEMKSFTGLEVEDYKELKPGHYLCRDGVVCYYQTPTVDWHTDAEETIRKQVRELVEAAVHKRVDTDLPIATFLSGGLDSSIVHLLCCRYHSNVTAIIIGDEMAEDVVYAKRLCHDFNLPYHHIPTTRESLLSNIPEIIYQVETFEPNPIRGSILSMQLAACAHQLGYKVVICGEGSDEIFGGYGDFLYLEEASAFQQRMNELLDDLYRTQLLRIDRTGMAYSVEVREPFLDRALVEYTLNIHPSLKTASLATGEKTTKYILREAFRDLLPDYIYARPKMTLMEGAGTGGVEKDKGVSYVFANDHVSDEEWRQIKEIYPRFCLRNKEEGYFCKVFHRHFTKAGFATTRVCNAQKEIKKGS